LNSVEIKKRDVVIDPFAGCGTVPLTAAGRKIHAVGVEVNPFLAFVSKTKLLSCSVKDLRCAADQVLIAIGRRRQLRSPLEGYSTFSPSSKNQKWLFNTGILRAFTSGSAAVVEAKPSVRRFLYLAMVKAAMDNCNAKADGKCLRYKQDWKRLDYDAEDFTNSFHSHLEMISADLESSSLEPSARVVNDDSRKAISGIPGKFRLCVTSPPYLNSFDYSDVYRPELFLMGMVNNNSQLRTIRLRTVRSHLQAAWDTPIDSDFGDLYSETVSKLTGAHEELWSPKIPLMIQAYFEDMKHILQQLYRRACPAGQVWLVVSTSAYGGIEIPVDLILAHVATKCGWLLREIGVIRQIRHAGHHWSKLPEEQRRTAKLRESVVVLERPTRERI
jgi:hypothetical protein